jgi:hypothetical protein
MITNIRNNQFTCLQITVNSSHLRRDSRHRSRVDDLAHISLDAGPRLVLLHLINKFLKFLKDDFLIRTTTIKYF